MEDDDEKVESLTAQQLREGVKLRAGERVVIKVVGQSGRYGGSAKTMRGATSAAAQSTSGANKAGESSSTGPSDDKGPLANPRWQRGGSAPELGFAHGEEAVLLVDASADNTPVRFIVEQERDGEWSTYQELRAVSSGGTASVKLKLAHPAAAARGSAAIQHARFRFHAELAA